MNIRSRSRNVPGAFRGTCHWSINLGRSSVQRTARPATFSLPAASDVGMGLQDRVDRVRGEAEEQGVGLKEQLIVAVVLMLRASIGGKGHACSSIVDRGTGP